MSSVAQTVLLIGTLGCVLVNAVEVVAKAVRARFVLKNCAEVGLDHRWIPHLAVIEGLGVIGLVIGLFRLPVLGLAAAGGLVLFFVVAIVVHIRARVFHTLAFPLGFLVLAVTAVGYFALRSG